MADTKQINGFAHSWGSIIAKAGGEEFYGFTAVSFADKIEETIIYGLGKAQGPRGRTRGKYSTEESKIKGPISTIAALRKALAALADDAKSYGTVEFPMTIQMVEADETPIIVELERCRLLSTTGSFSEGPDGLEEEVAIKPLFVTRDGLTLYDSSQKV